MSAELSQHLASLLGPKGWLTAADDIVPYLAEWRGRYSDGRTIGVARPATTEEVSRVVAACAAAGVPMVPQGGNTGLVGGAAPHPHGHEVVIACGRLSRIRDLDAANGTITVEAGVTLKAIQDAAAAADRLFPLSLGAEGTCQIGGNLSTNAGGNAVLRYGNARSLVLGVEVVMPDGQVLDALRGLRKDNTGYDLKQLFIGAEGTLGIITAAVLKLFPRPRTVETAFLAVPSPAAALDLLVRCRSATGDQVSSFELIPRIGLDFALRHVSGTVDPLAGPSPWYVLLEAASSAPDAPLRESLASLLEVAFEAEIVTDGTFAESETQRQSLWFLREAMVEAQRHAGASIKNDVSVPVSAVPDFIDQALTAVEQTLPGIRPVAFGHLGDGNIHLNLSQPEGVDRAAYLAHWGEMTALVDDIATRLGGSISAEHGIGRAKRDTLARHKSPTELRLMQAIKDAIDPRRLMNPGKVLPD